MKKIEVFIVIRFGRNIVFRKKQSNLLRKFLNSLSPNEEVKIQLIKVEEKIFTKKPSNLIFIENNKELKNLIIYFSNLVNR
jgi:hypothetical protein